MSIEVELNVNKIAKPTIKKTFVEFRDGFGTDREIASLGLAKGDLIVFRGEGDPVRFPSGTASGKVLTTDPTSETGWVLSDGGGGGGSSATAILHNATGGIVETGTIVKIDSGTNFVKATSADTDPLFVVSDECADDEDVACYSIRNTICLVRCTTDEVTVGDSLTLSSTNGLLEKRTDTTQREVAVALTGKLSGNAGTVKALLSDINEYAVLEIKDGGTGASNASGARTNLGAVSKSGDTMTGDLQFATPNHIVHQSPHYSQDETPSDSYFDDALKLVDSDGNRVGNIQHRVLAWNSSMGVNITAARNVNGSPVYNGVGLLIDPSGGQWVDLGDAAPAWRTALTWEKAGDATGTNTVTIPDTATEVMAVVQAGTNSVRFSNTIPKTELADIWFIGGYYSASNDYGIVNVNVTNSKKTFQLRTVKYGNGTDLKASSKLTIYYK